LHTPPDAAPSASDGRHLAHRNHWRDVIFIERRSSLID